LHAAEAILTRCLRYVEFHVNPRDGVARPKGEGFFHIKEGRVPYFEHIAVVRASIYWGSHPSVLFTEAMFQQPSQKPIPEE